MTLILKFIGVLGLMVSPVFSQSFDYKKLNNTHSLTLPSWGSYMKQYNGISHVPQLSSGMHFDFSIHPGNYLKRRSFPANTRSESGFHFWEAAPDLSYYAVRYELEWKDKVYCDVAFYKIDDNTTAVRYEMVNNTNLTQDLSVQNFANVNYPSERPYSLVPLYPAIANLPVGATWVDDASYYSIRYNKSFPQLNLVYDGQILGISPFDSAVGGTILGKCSWQGKSFGETIGDNVVYPFVIPSNNVHSLVFRYRIEKNSESLVRIQTENIDTIVKLIGSGIFETFALQLPNNIKQNNQLSITAVNVNSLQLDGFAVVPSQNVSDVSFQVKMPDYKPQIDSLSANRISLAYRDIAGKYIVSTINAPFILRNFIMDELDKSLRENINVNKYNDEFYSTKTFKEQGDIHRTNLFMKQLTIAPMAKKVFYTILQYQKNSNEPIVSLNENQLELLYLQQRKKALMQQYNSAGEPYAFSQRLMAATLLTNVVYPVYTNGTYILHNTPGRVWDCLYTWDNGFIALGLADLDIQRSLECVNAYTMKPDDQSAFLHHGTPLPIQIYAMKELWEKTNDKEMLAYLYPRLKQYYQFLAGDYLSSTTRKFNSNILATWDYFYNSGGWDDYPPQVFVHANQLESSVAPIINTAHAIRTAKILLQAAKSLNITADIKLYTRDIAMFSSAIQQHAWDKKSGYFGYVVHDEKTNAKEILRTSDGVNMNMGLDGCYPLVAGICTKEQQDSIVQRLFTLGKIWSAVGLSTVDQSAPYYLKSGYWNGSVWMPHQWLFFKTMFDLGLNDKAMQIAKTALDIWKQETDDTYNCYEVFRIETGRAGGWHQFGGLSSPVINWYASMYKPGTITAGFDVWIDNKQFSDDFSSVQLTATSSYTNEGSHTLWICMNDKFSYKIEGSTPSGIELRQEFPGLLSIKVNNKIKTLHLNISKQ